jgi:nicotinamidase-related amidase
MAEVKLVVTPENTAVIIHDMENGFWKPPYTSSNKAESIIAPIQNILAVARRLNVPIIYTLVSPAFRGLAKAKDRRHAGCGEMRRGNSGSRSDR